MKCTNYNYTDEAGSHQKWKRARRIHLITPLSTNCPSMQTRKPPTVAGSIVEATTGQARGQGRKRHTQGTAPGSLFIGYHMELVGDLGMGQDACHVDTAGQALSNGLPKSSVTSGERPAALSLGEAGKNGTGPDAFGDVRARCLRKRLIR